MHVMDNNDAVKEKIRSFFAGFTEQKFTKGEIIIQSSDPLNQVYFLAEGLVKQYTYSENGDEVTLHVYRPNSFFPIMLILSGEQNRHFFQALTPVTVRKAGKDPVLDFIKQNPDVLFNLTTRFAQAISGLATRLEIFMPENAYVKICALLIYLAKAFGKKSEKGVEIQLPLTHREIASWIGITRETASRQIEILISKGVIIQGENHSIIIPQIEKLHDEIAADHEN